MKLCIEEWQWDEANIEHLAKRGISPAMIEEEIWLERPKYNRNRKGRSASHFMIGPNRSGTFWTICIVQVSSDPATWRVITGWRSKVAEEGWYRRAR